MFVWFHKLASYGIALVIMLANAILPGRQQRRILKELRSRMHRREQSE